MKTGILFLAVVYSVAETAYFGWNWFPKSDGELICDGISLVLFALAFIWRPA